MNFKSTLTIVRIKMLFALFIIFTHLKHTKSDSMFLDNPISFLNTSKIIHTSAIIRHSTQLPCFVQRNKKYVWMNAATGEIISVDNSLISSNKRFRLQDSPICFSNSRMNTEKNYFKVNINPTATQQEFSGCWRNLFIDDVEMKDEGVYICQIDTMLTHKVYLVVNVPPYFKDVKENRLNMDMSNLLSHKYVSNHINVVEGKTLNLNCTAFGKPRPVIKWFSFDRQFNITIDINHTGPLLRLRNFSRYSHSIYECVASNGINPSISKRFMTNILYPPSVSILNVDKSFSCRDVHKPSLLTNKTVRLNCITHGKPRPNIQWLLSGRIVNRESSSEGIYQIFEKKIDDLTFESQLLLRNLSAFNLDVKYTCRAYNNVGKISKSINPCPFTAKQVKKLHSQRDKQNLLKNSTLFKKPSSDVLSDLHQDTIGTSQSTNLRTYLGPNLITFLVILNKLLNH